MKTIPDETGFTDGGEQLVCPECGLDYVHPTGLRCDPVGRDAKLVTVDADGVSERKSDIDGRRGVEITLQFECENGHLFQYLLSFHKGHTFLKTQAISLIFNSLICRTIWRD